VFRLGGKVRKLPLLQRLKIEAAYLAAGKHLAKVDAEVVAARLRGVKSLPPLKLPANVRLSKRPAPPRPGQEPSTVDINDVDLGGAAKKTGAKFNVVGRELNIDLNAGKAAIEAQAE